VVVNPAFCRMCFVNEARRDSPFIKTKYYYDNMKKILGKGVCSEVVVLAWPRLSAAVG
jgi:hypothetical protein